MLELAHDVYKEVVKPIVGKARLEVETMVFSRILLHFPFEKGTRIDLDCE